MNSTRRANRSSSTFEFVMDFGMDENDSLRLPTIVELDEFENFVHYDDQEEDGQRAFTFVCSLFMLVLCAIGALGNLLSALIFTRRCMKSSINVLLTGLSFVDLSVVVIAVPVFAIPGLNAYGHFGNLASLQRAIVFGLYQFAVIAQTCSAYMFVLITVERFFAVCHPLQVQRMFTVRRAKSAQYVVFFLSVLYNLCRFWEYKGYSELDGSEGYVRALRANEAYFLGYYTALYLLVHFLIPFSIIAVLNTRIASTILVAESIRSRMITTTKSAAVSVVLTGQQEPRGQRQITRMIIIVTAVFAATNVLPFCLNLFESIYPASFDFARHGHEWHSIVAYTLTEISNVLVVLNSSINFVIYMLYCRKYRRMFFKIFFLSWAYGSSRRGSNGSDVNRSVTTIGANHQPLLLTATTMTGDSSTTRRQTSRMLCRKLDGSISGSASANSFC